MYILHLVLVGCPIPQEARPEALTMGIIKAYEQQLRRLLVSAFVCLFVYMTLLEIYQIDCTRMTSRLSRKESTVTPLYNGCYIILELQ